MSDELKHECAVALVVLRKDGGHYRAKYGSSDFGGTKLSLLLEKQHNRGQDGAGAAILSDHPEPGEPPYWVAKSASATPLADLLGMLTKRSRIETGFERAFLGHLRYATFGKNELKFCHPFVHEASDLRHTLLLAGNFNLTNAHELFDDYSRHGSFPTSKADGYLICELIAHELEKSLSLRGDQEFGSFGEETPQKNLQDSKTPSGESNLSAALSCALANADGAWTLCGMTGDGWAFATRDPHGIRPGFYYVDDEVVVVASERPAIQAAFDVPPEAVQELPPGQALVVSPEGEVEFCDLDNRQATTDRRSSDDECPPLAPPRPCSFERIYFSRANDADIHRERKALGAALLPRILEAAGAPLEDIFFSYIPNSARIAFHGLLEELINRILTQRHRDAKTQRGKDLCASEPLSLCVNALPRFGEIAVKDAKFRTFIADAAARREFYKHVYDVTYGLVRPGQDTLVVLDDSIVRGNTMKNAILPMLDRLGPKRIVIASSAPPIRYPDCYGIDMSTLGELVAFRALVNLLGNDASDLLHEALMDNAKNPLAALYARFTEEQHAAEIARLLTPADIKAEVVVVYQTVEDLRRCLAHETANHEPRATNHEIGDWYFTGDYPTPGGYRVLRRALLNYLDKNSERSY